MVKLKILDKLSEYDKKEIDSTLANMLEASKRLSELDNLPKEKINKQEKEANLKVLKKISEELDYIFFEA